MERAQVFSSCFSFTDCWHWVPQINSLWATSKQSAPELGHGLAPLTLTWACVDYSWSVCPLYSVCVWRSKIALIRLAQILIRCNHSSTEVCPACPPGWFPQPGAHSASSPVLHCGGDATAGSFVTKGEAPWLHHQLGQTVHFPHPLLRWNKFVNHTQHCCYNRRRRFVHMNHMKIYWFNPLFRLGNIMLTGSSV